MHILPKFTVYSFQITLHRTLIFAGTGLCCVVYEGPVAKKSKWPAYANDFVVKCCVKKRKIKAKRKWKIANAVQTNVLIVFHIITNIGKHPLFGTTVLFVLVPIATPIPILVSEMLMAHTIICTANLLVV